MSDHDPLCPMLDDSLPPICVCGVIARVRAYERERHKRILDLAAAGVRAEAKAGADAYADGYRDGEDAMQSVIDQAKADAVAREREKIAADIEAEKLDPKAQGRLTVENRDYPLTRDDVLIINGVRNRDARIARDRGQP